jgi:hypothetical protein
MPLTATTATAFTAFLFGSACSAAVLVRGDHIDGSSAAVQSGDFIVHSRHSDASGFGDSLGYLTAEYSYAPGWDVILDTSKSHADTCYISDINNAKNASLEFSRGRDNEKGLLLTPRSEKWPNGRVTMLSGQHGTPGMSIVDGLFQWQASDGIEITWFGKSQLIVSAIFWSVTDLLEACPDTSLELFPATTLGYKWANTTTTQGCFDVDMVIEYI